MDLDQIQVRGARENNLRDVSVDIPKRAITVFTGVCGSGKSSLVFGTIAAESQRLINETYMGPGPGHDGGEVVFAGPPRALLDAEDSLTARHLAQHLAAATD